MKFPYGISDFYKLITEGHFYLDRTDCIPLIEAAGSQLSIGQDPTPLHNQYFILKWDFSAVSPLGDAASIEQALHDYVNGSIKRFMTRYRVWIEHDIVLNTNNALSSFQSLLTAIEQSAYRLYLFIDEYDNFANEILMGGPSQALNRYTELLYGEGILKTLFKAVKSASSGLGLDRAFITGVSPVVLSDVTSGYNIAENISLQSTLPGGAQAVRGAASGYVAARLESRRGRAGG